MAINLNTPFHRTGPVPIDDSLILSKADMLAVDDTMMPDLYFALCSDDGALYFYNKANTPSGETGKYVKQSTQGTTYTAGTGIDITNDEISVDDTVIATKTDLDDYYTKAETDAKFSGLYHYKGSVATYADLPSTGQTEGDVYNVEEDGMNYAWNGTKWDELGALIDLSDYYTKTEVDTELAKKITDPTTKADGDILKWDETAGEWKAEAGGTGSGSLENALTSTIEVGGIKANTPYTAGTSLEQLFKDLLAPALVPKITEPSTSITYYTTTLLEVGATIPAMDATVVFSRGSITPAYGTSGFRSGEATNYHFETSGADTNFTPANQTTATFAVPALTRSTKGDIVVTGSADYGAGEQPKDSEGNDFGAPCPAGTKTGTKTYEFIFPFYWGASNTRTVDLSTLTKDISKKGNKSYDYTTANQYIVFAYDKSYGNLTSILDQNGFETISSYDKIVDGDFNIYVMQTPSTDTGATTTFKF